jgi:dTDP-4-dehydrorhamnose 3,5-epimerase
MIIEETNFIGLTLIKPKIYADKRGLFLESYQYSRYASIGISDVFVQDNQSWSIKGVLRGMHYQISNPQAQLLTVMKGVIFDVVVDLRQNSKTYGQWYGVRLGGNDFPQIYMAPGFAHGFYVLSDEVGLHYKVTQEYDPADEGGLIWDDIDVSISWPDGPKILTPKDLAFPRLRNIDSTRLPQVLKL